MYKKATGIFFSPTGTNKTTVSVITGALSEDNRLIDLTLPCSETDHTFGPEDLVVIGGPVYGGCISKAALSRFEKLRGNSTPCVITATYGNRDYDDALTQLADFMKKRGFLPVAAAALVGRHTYGSIQTERPDSGDAAMNRDFAGKIREKLINNDLSEPFIKGNRPPKEGGGPGRFRPLTSEACISCGLCRKNCPQGAIGDDLKTIDTDLCLSCFRCIRNCPVGAKNMDTPEYNEFAEGFSRRLAARRENEYFI